jgi:hypothetical protein
MNVDRWTKVLLGMIALGLWMQIALPWIQPRIVRAEAGQATYDQIVKALQGIHVALSGIRACRE